jgi:hypothetical protein
MRAGTKALAGIMWGPSGCGQSLAFQALTTGDPGDTATVRRRHSAQRNCPCQSLQPDATTSRVGSNPVTAPAAGQRGGIRLVWRAYGYHCHAIDMELHLALILAPQIPVGAAMARVRGYSSRSPRTGRRSQSRLFLIIGIAIAALAIICLVTVG